MARNVFISVLGTGFYGECQYQSEGFTSSSTRFIQTATLEKIGAKDWNKDDVIYILLTEQARQINWTPEKEVRMNRIIQKEETYYGLEKEIKAMNLPCQLYGVGIPDGKDEKEIWEMFSTVFELLKEGDELHFDLTHAFRFLPMLMLVMGNYARFLRNTQVQEMVYGNYEARDSGTNIAPIIDLLPLVSLQEWSYAAGQYMDSGNAKALENISRPILNSIVKATQGGDKVAKNTSTLIKFLGSVVDEMRNCRGRVLYEGKSIRVLKDRFKDLSETSLRALNPILERMRQDFDELKGNKEVANGYSAAKWCFDKGLYQQSITLLMEAVVTFFCLRHEFPIYKKKKEDTDYRKLVSDTLGIISGKEKLTEDYREVFEILSKDELCTQKLAKQFIALGDDRNDYNHAGMRAKVSHFKDLAQRLGKKLDFFEDLFHTISVVPSTQLEQNKLFLNLSNHPHHTWNELQLEAARALGELQDMSFPAIAPEATEEEIAALADEYVQKILAHTEGKQVIVHLMGELTFCFALVRRLEEVGITCVASCSQRDVEELPDGRKQSAFHFTRFRRYVL